jgi:predicted O-methyltransferase YrrM
VNLDDIKTESGTREWLTEHWIEAVDQAKVEAEGSPNPYLDDTYDFYSSVAAYVKPKTILEIGVYKGYSMAAMLKGANGSVHVALGVDISLGGEGVTMAAIKKLRQEFPDAGVCYLEIDSQTEYAKVPKGPFDIVHIDGDHSYEACTNDLSHFGPLVSETGVVIVHDANDPPVWQAACEFAYRHRMDYRKIENACGNVIMCRRQS